MKFNKEQQQALDFRGNVVVSAGAGSGKTRVLVEKYFQLLTDEHPTWSVDSVVAITFTKKAAAELKDRIVARIEGEVDLAGDSRRRDRLVELRNDMPWAPIGTIHNLCTRILRENAFDIRLNPDFAIVEGAEVAAFANKAIRNIFAESIEDASGQSGSDLLVMLSFLKQSTLEKELFSMLDKRAEFLGPAKRYAGTSADALYKELAEFQATSCSAPPSECIKGIYQAIKALGQIAVGGLSTAVESLLAGWPPEGCDAAWKDCEACVNAIAEQLFSQKMTVRARLFKNTTIDDTHPDIETLVRHIKMARQFQHEPVCDLDRQNLEICQCLSRLFLRVVNEYARLRSASQTVQESDFLDFSDLELKTQSLIRSSGEVRARLRREFRYLIVDEFQDTSEIQWEILSSLVTDESGELLPGRLFVVGDQKQGIYGFRNANVTLFQNVQTIVESANRKFESSSGLISMQRNYRTSRLPLGVINTIFEEVLGDPSSVDQVKFEPLLHRPGAPMGELKVFITTESDEFAADDDDEPEMPAKSGTESRDEDGDVVVEADHIADYVAELVAGGTEPAQIAILFRKRAYFSEYQQALEGCGVPCSVQKTGKLFLQREIIDVLAPLHVALNPFDDARVLCYLRSSLINFTDDLLLKIALRKEDSLWEKCLGAEQDGEWSVDSKRLTLESQEKNRIQAATDLVGQLTPRVNLLPVSDMIELIYANTGARIVMAADSGWSKGSRQADGNASIQAGANLEKLLSIARENETMTLPEFIEYVEDEKAVDMGREEASLDMEASAGVRIMTIHASKGLEFDVVILPQLNDQIRPRGTTLATDGQRWIALQLAEDFRGKQKIFLHRHLNDLDLRRAANEERRVLYVAMTRCRQTLVLSATIHKKERNSFYQWIRHLLGSELPESWGVTLEVDDVRAAEEDGGVDVPDENDLKEQREIKGAVGSEGDLFARLSDVEMSAEHGNGHPKVYAISQCQFADLEFRNRRKLLKMGLLLLRSQGDRCSIASLSGAFATMPELELIGDIGVEDFAAAVMRAGKMLVTGQFDVALRPVRVGTPDGLTRMFYPDAFREGDGDAWVYLVLDKSEADAVSQNATAHMEAVEAAGSNQQVLIWELTGKHSEIESSGVLPEQLDFF